MNRILSGVLAAALLLPCTALPAEAAEPAAVHQSVSQSQSVFTRGMAVQRLYQWAGSPAISSPCPFSDLPAQYREAAAWAAEGGYWSGTGEALFSPDLPLTQQALAAVLYRMAGSPTPNSPGLLERQTISGWDDWARSAGLWAVRAQLLPDNSPQSSLTEEQLEDILDRFAAMPQLDTLQTDLEALTQAPRPIGSQGEQQAAQYLSQRLAQLGYSVTLQPYTNVEGQTGTNVVAVREAQDSDSDILVLSTHHDSFPTTYGASDNASGAAALLAVAEALADVPTDTELRLISFTDEESGKNGSRYYTSTLSQEEKDRMVGAIQIDMLGGLGTAGTLVCTMDGTANWLSGLLQAQSPALSLGAQTASDHASFQLEGIPSVLITQDGQGYLYHSAGDTAGTVDLWRVAGAAAAVTRAAGEILSPDTPSYLSLAQSQGEGYTYCQTRQTTIYFGASRSDTQAYLGASGTLANQWQVEGEGWTDSYESDCYSMRWFGREEPLNTYYIYRNGFLDHIEICPEETDCTAQDMRRALESMYGSPTHEDGDSVGWADPIYSKYLTLSSKEGECLVTVSRYSLGITNVLSSYSVLEGEAQISDPEDAKVWDLVCTILPPEARQSIAQFSLFTDGYSNILAYTAPVQREDGTSDNTRFSISIDYYDVYDEAGRPRDWSKLIYTILHEYGHVLLEDDRQIDLTVGTGTHDPAGFREGSFRKAFYDAFWADLGDSAVEDYSAHPTHYVSRYGANYFHEDIADTFAVFVLGDTPQEDTVAAEKLRFFAQDGEMAGLRRAIRDNLGLS